MTHSKFKIQNSKFSLPRYDPFTAKPGFFLAQVVGFSAFAFFASALAGRSMSFDASS